MKFFSSHPIVTKTIYAKGCVYPCDSTPFLSSYLYKISVFKTFKQFKGNRIMSLDYLKTKFKLPVEEHFRAASRVQQTVTQKQLLLNIDAQSTVDGCHFAHLIKSVLNKKSTMKNMTTMSMKTMSHSMQFFHKILIQKTTK